MIQRLYNDKRILAFLACGSALALALLAGVLPKDGLLPQRQNAIAAVSFLTAAFGLWSLFRALRLSGLFSDVVSHRVPLPARVRLVALAMAVAWGLVSLPPAFRLIDDVRALRVYSLDEPLMLDSIQRYVNTRGSTPDLFRLTQGWFTYLPVAFLSKAVNAAIPVNLAMINMLMRFYQLTVWCAASYFAVVLLWRLTRSAILSPAIVLASLWYTWPFNFSLRIDRPDGFNLLFIVLCLLSVLDLLERKDAKSYFVALCCAALSFSARYVGMVMLPTIGAVFLWQQWQRVPGADIGKRRQTLWPATGVFIVSSGLIFLLVFVAASPYHLVHFKTFFSQMVYFSGVYQSGNAYNLPDFNPPPSPVLWWRFLTEAGRSDAFLAALAGFGLLSAIIAGLLALRRRIFPPYLVMTIFTVTYGLFLIYQHGGDYVLYHYLFPVLPSIPYFAVLPLVLLCARWTGSEAGLPRPVGNRAVVVVGALMLVASASICWSAKDRLQQARAFLTAFRQTDKPEFAVGRFLDKHVPLGREGRVLPTWWVYIPARFTKADIYNVSFTLKLVKDLDPDYVIVSHNYYEVYAGKYATTEKNRLYPGYNVYYNDVVDAYTVFKERRHPDFKLLTTIEGFDIFERRRAQNDASN